MNDDTTVSIEQGELRGKRLRNGRRFAGIPYAAPPIGGLQGGSGDCWPFFYGSFLPDDVVLVTLNYRLNIFGFL